ncbi:MAG: DUF1385 domain-containing protein [Candidatus Bathyarchaeota archaeon]|nr:MAG: DUF1385 domain-containing protein [Candidatus Bathyarchaeota archaeon]
MMKLFAQRREEPSLAFGGQALIEGVMMRSRTHVVMCIRQPNKEILTHTEETKSISGRHKILGLLFLRGIIALFETFYLGVKGLYYSANAILEEEEKFTVKEFAIAIAMALALTSLFMIGPYLLASLFHLTGVIFNIVEAIIRLMIFLLYLILVSMWGEFKRVLQYHGAEHKAINAHEAGVALNVLNVKKFSRLHPRCGTSFIFIVVLVSILLFSIMPDLGFAARLSYRVLLIPVIGAISYELLKLSDRHKNSKITRILTMPGLAFQRLTTREPDEDMIEVAVEAVKEVKRLSSS